MTGFERFRWTNVCHLVARILLDLCFIEFIGRLTDSEGGTVALFVLSDSVNKAVNHIMWQR